MEARQAVHYAEWIVGERHAGPRSGKRRGRSSERRRLLAGVDFCEHARELADRGRVIEPGHLAVCAVCARRWRVTEAKLQAWAPLDHDEAAAIMPAMAEAFESAERDGRYRPFYAHLARCPTCEHEFARLTFARPVPALHTAVLPT
jgi:hypothetical protein